VHVDVIYVDLFVSDAVVVWVVRVVVSVSRVPASNSRSFFQLFIVVPRPRDHPPPTHRRPAYLSYMMKIFISPEYIVIEDSCCNCIVTILSARSVTFL